MEKEIESLQFQIETLKSIIAQLEEQNQENAKSREVMHENERLRE